MREAYAIYWTPVNDTIQCRNGVAAERTAGLVKRWAEMLGIERCAAL